MKNIFDLMLEKQAQLQKRLGDDVMNMDLKERAAFIKEHALWTIDECSEMLHELPYAKGWSKKYDSWNDEKIKEQQRLCKEEFIDILTFLMNVALGLGFTGEEIEKMYLDKNNINHDRQNGGY